MLLITDEAALERALASSLSTACKHVLRIRREFLDIATFVVVETGNTIAAVAAAAGFPIDIDAPPWEWVIDHAGAFEAPIIHSDDGSGTVLIVPDSLHIDATLLGLLRAIAQPADPLPSTSHEGQQSDRQ